MYGNNRMPGIVMGSGFGNQDVDDSEVIPVECEMVVGSAFGTEDSSSNSKTHDVPLNTATTPARVPSLEFTRLPTMRTLAGRASMEKSFQIAGGTVHETEESQKPAAAPMPQTSGLDTNSGFAHLTTTRTTASHTLMDNSRAVGGLSMPVTSPGFTGHSMNVSSAPENSSSTLKKKFDDGGRGAGSNIYSIYADPEDRETWQFYNLDKAQIVISCMVAGQEAEVRLSDAATFFV